MQRFVNKLAIHQIP